MYVATYIMCVVHIHVCIHVGTMYVYQGTHCRPGMHTGTCILSFLIQIRVRP